VQNMRLYPLERNRYFYGKLLTVRDFESEQKYFNAKRRLLNRLLHGTGIVSGLQVVRVDDKTVSVEPGVALDQLGREVVVASPVTLKLSATPGFTNNAYAKNVYLCIAYDEKGKEPVHSVGNAAGRTEEVSEYNRIAEGYRLFIREEAPDPSTFDARNLTHTSRLLYEESTSHARIVQTAPRYVQAGGVFAVTLCIEKPLQTQKVSFEAELVLAGCKQFEPGSDGRITFSEAVEGQSSRLEYTCWLQAANIPGEKLSVGLQTGTLTIGDTKTTVHSAISSEVHVAQGDLQETLMRDYFTRPLSEALESSDDPCLYLAKIELSQMGSTYVIEKVQPAPFAEYISSSHLLSKFRAMPKGETVYLLDGQTFTARASTKPLEQGQPPELSVDYDQQKQEFHFELGLPQSSASTTASPMKMNTGTVEIQLKPDDKPGFTLFYKITKSFLSEEINHGLGEGDVLVRVGVEESTDNTISDMLSRAECVYYGDQSVFKDSEYAPEVPQVALGTVVYPKRGTFHIGLKLQETTSLSRIRLRWWAFKNE